jgi:hypothetical protein
LRKSCQALLLLLLAAALMGLVGEAQAKVWAFLVLVVTE